MAAALLRKKTMAAALFIVFACSAFVKLSEGAVYKVGDSLGWTILGNPNYTAWALSKTFHVGDTILFEYNSQFHNVKQVNRSDYKACNSGSALATHTSGNDSIVIKTRGHHFFLCGVPGHCALGQKVDIRIPKLAAASSAAPSAAPTAPPVTPAPTGPSAGSPKASHAPTTRVALAGSPLSVAAAVAISTLILS